MNMPAVFVSHDMCHVIAAYEPIGVDEIALGAMQLGMTDSDAHWLQFLGNLGVHEAGFLDGGGTLVPKESGLSRPGAPETIAHAFWRGPSRAGRPAARGRPRVVRHPGPHVLTIC